MDYRNGDGSIAEMCGNGVRVFARYLQRAGLVDRGRPRVATRGGREARAPRQGRRRSPSAWAGPLLPEGDVTVSVGERSWPARNVNMGNPHAVAFVDDLAHAGRPVRAAAVQPRPRPTRTGSTSSSSSTAAPPRRHARPRARLGRDPLLRHRRLRRRRRRRPPRRRRPGGDRQPRRPTPSTCPAARLVITERAGRRDRDDRARGDRRRGRDRPRVAGTAWLADTDCSSATARRPGAFRPVEPRSVNPTWILARMGDPFHARREAVSRAWWAR